MKKLSKYSKLFYKTSYLFKLCLLFIFPFMCSCGSKKSTTYFYDVPNSVYQTSSIKSKENVLQENDLLSISVSSINQKATEMFNTSNQAATGSTSSNGVLAQASGYLIDNNGFIRFSVLGEIKAAGKTKKELRTEITEALINRKLLLEPIVDIRQLNFRVSVLGEVSHPNVFTIPSEKISILEALSMAGDITIHGNKEEVVLIRENENEKIFQRIDLTNSEIFNNPYYYLQSNDIIYVAPKSSKVAESSAVQPWIPIILSTISLAIITIVSFQ